MPATKRKARGKFIVLEGIDGSGSTTQVGLLVQSLRQSISVGDTYEPSKGAIGLFIRDILSGEIKTDPEALALLFAADRRDHLEKEIRPAVEKSEWIICDRYFLSSLAYQSQKCSIDWVCQINDGILIPDLTILIDLPASEALKRVDERSSATREIFETLPQQRKIRKLYLELAENSKKYQLGPVQVIRGTGDIGKVSSLIRQAVEHLLEA